MFPAHTTPVCDCNTPGFGEGRDDAVRVTCPPFHTTITVKTDINSSKDSKTVPADRLIRFRRNIIDDGSPIVIQPQNFQVVPVGFGILNATWDMEPEFEQRIINYEIVLLTLDKLMPTSKQQKCLSLFRKHNMSHLLPVGYQNYKNRLTFNVTTPMKYIVIKGLPPDMFYRILLHTRTQNSGRSRAASIPSSPRVPALLPIIYPEQIRIISIGSQQVEVSWKKSDDSECTGEFINFVISINSTHSHDDQLLFEVSRDTRRYVVNDLVPGMYYDLRMASSTRAGAGKFSAPIRFKTRGVPLEFRQEFTNEWDELEERKYWSQHNTDHLDRRAAGKWDINGELIILKIDHLRATPTQTTLKLEWVIRIMTHESATDETGNMSELDPQIPHGIYGPIGISPASISLRYVLEWGEKHPGPARVTVPGDQTWYTIENLNPGTIYYIRMVVMSKFGTGPSKYTTMLTLTSASGVMKNLQKFYIPINLVALSVGSSWAQISWDLPQLPGGIPPEEYLFQIKYHKSGISDADVKLFNITFQLNGENSQRPNYLRTILRGLEPATSYEFAVRCILSRKQENLDIPINNPVIETHWSMVQGFVTAPVQIQTLGLSPTLSKTIDDRKIMPDAYSKQSIPTNISAQRQSNADQLRWIIIGCAVGGILVISATCMTLVFSRCLRARDVNATANIKTFTSSVPTVPQSESTWSNMDRTVIQSSMYHPRPEFSSADKAVCLIGAHAHSSSRDEVANMFMHSPARSRAEKLNMLNHPCGNDRTNAFLTPPDQYPGLPDHGHPMMWMHAGSEMASGYSDECRSIPMGSDIEPSGQSVASSRKFLLSTEPLPSNHSSNHFNRTTKTVETSSAHSDNFQTTLAHDLRTPEIFSPIMTTSSLSPGRLRSVKEYVDSEDVTRHCWKNDAMLGKFHEGCMQSKCDGPLVSSIDRPGKAVRCAQYEDEIVKKFQNNVHSSVPTTDINFGIYNLSNWKQHTATDEWKRVLDFSMAIDRAPTPDNTVPYTTSNSAVPCCTFERNNAVRLMSDRPMMNPHSPSDVCFSTPIPIRAKQHSVEFCRDNDSDITTSMTRGYSAEQLSREMVNLDGLMKDLNDLSKAQFAC